MSSPVAATKPGVKKPRYLLTITLKIVLDLLIPTAGYYTLRGMGFGQLVALGITVLPAVAYFLYRVGRGQKVDAFETFILLIIAASDGASFIAGSPRLFLSTDGWTSFVISLACILSLRARRPLVYLLIRSLLDNTPLRVKYRTAEWEDIWERDQTFRRAWVVSTMVWAALDGIAGVIRMCIAFLVPVDTAPMLLGVVTITWVVGLQIWQSKFLKKQFRAAGTFAPKEPGPRLLSNDVVGLDSGSAQAA